MIGQSCLIDKRILSRQSYTPTAHRAPFALHSHAHTVPIARLQRTFPISLELVQLMSYMAGGQAVRDKQLYRSALCPVITME